MDICIVLRSKKFYKSKPIDFLLDCGCSSFLKKKSTEKGIYVIFTKNDKKEIIYVGKTHGKKMNFSKRLYRHNSSSASRNSEVYKYLKNISNNKTQIYVTLLNTKLVLDHFKTDKFKMTDECCIDILEQALICYLRPRFGSGANISRINLTRKQT